MSPRQSVDNAVDCVLTYPEACRQPPQRDGRVERGLPALVQVPDLQHLCLRQLRPIVPRSSQSRLRLCRLRPASFRNGILDIVGLRSHPKMIGSYTQGCVAPVKHKGFRLQGSTEQQVRDAVCGDLFTVPPKTSVAFRRGTCPQPAPVDWTDWYERQKAGSRVFHRSRLPWIHTCWHGSSLLQGTRS